MTNEERLKLKEKICKLVMTCEDDGKLHQLLGMVDNKTTAQHAKRFIKFRGFGKEQTAPRWAEELGLPRNVLWRYINKGLTIEQIVELRGIKYPAD